MLLAPMAQRLEGVHVHLLRQVTEKKENRVRYGSWRLVTEKNTSRERGHSRSGHMWAGDRRQWQSGWPYVLFLTFVQEIRIMREGGDSGLRGGGRRQRRSS